MTPNITDATARSIYHLNTVLDEVRHRAQHVAYPSTELFTRDPDGTYTLAYTVEGQARYKKFTNKRCGVTTIVRRFDGKRIPARQLVEAMDWSGMVLYTPRTA